MNLSFNTKWNLFYYSDLILCIDLHQQIPLSRPVRPVVVWHETVSCTWCYNGQCAPTMISLSLSVKKTIGNNRNGKEYYLIAIKRM